jgi:phage FluMu protein Com
MTETRLDRTWEPLRCRSCQRKLLMATPASWHADCAIEVKCGRCNQMNYLIGRPESAPKSEAMATT